MTKFMLLYRGDATPREDMTEEQGAAVTAQWGAWIEKHGSTLSDIGQPFMGGRAAVGGDGNDQTPVSLNGYTIVEADSLEAAKGFCDGHPFLQGAGADFAIDVYELTPMEM
jgi:formylmethanofuran dehydrogenase subunit C